MDDIDTIDNQDNPYDSALEYHDDDNEYQECQELSAHSYFVDNIREYLNSYKKYNTRAKNIKILTYIYFIICGIAMSCYFILDNNNNQTFFVIMSIDFFTWLVSALYFCKVISANYYIGYHYSRIKDTIYNLGTSLLSDVDDERNKFVKYHYNIFCLGLSRLLYFVTLILTIEDRNFNLTIKFIPLYVFTFTTMGLILIGVYYVKMPNSNNKEKQILLKNITQNVVDDDDDDDLS